MKRYAKINKALVLNVVFVLFVLLLDLAFALDCPKFPELAQKDWEVKVGAEVAKIGNLKGAELKTTTRSVTQDLLTKLPDSGKVYLEQMMFAAYCSTLRDDKTLTETEKSERIKEYNREVRNTINPKKTSSPKKTKQKSDKDETPKDNIKTHIAVYVYERGYKLDGEKKTYYYEMRNLANNCSLWRQEISNLCRGRSITPTPIAKIIMKLFLDNPSKILLSNVRVGLRGMKFENVFCTPNIECSMKSVKTSNEATATQVIMIPSLSPTGKAVLSLETPIDRKTYKENTRITVLIPFVTSDQINITQPKLLKFNAMEMIKLESELRTGERTFADERIEYRILCPDEPDIVEHKFEPLPPAKKCAKGIGDNW